MLSPNVHITGSFLANFSWLIIKGKKNYYSIDNHGFNQCLEKFSFELKFKIFFKKINSFLTISTAYREMLFILDQRIFSKCNWLKMSSLSFFNFVKIGLREKIMPCLSVYERDF